ncbi:MAG: VOC family protein, partial [Pseudomonas sp.]
MIDHTGIIVADPAKSRAFYEKALRPIGYSVLIEVPKEHTAGATVLGYGVMGKADFWVASGSPNKPALHVAFRVETRAEVDAFHKAALAA